MKAIYICKDLADYIRKEKLVEGHVHSVFKNACNIETKDKFITLLSKGKYMAPMSLTLDNQEEFNFIRFGIRQDLKVEINVNVIKFGGGEILVSLYDANRCSPKPILTPSVLIEENILDNINLIENKLKTEGKLYGMGPLINILKEEIPELNVMTFPIAYEDNKFQFIKSRFISFMKALIEGDMNIISYEGEGVIGFGVGLTPSVDDFICGVMISFIYLGNHYKLDMTAIYEFNRELIKRGLNKTTKVSSEMLKHSSIGKTNEAVRELMFSILHELDKEKVIKALNKTINFGETSGSDTALGMYVGCKIMTNSRYRRVWVNELMCRY